MSNRQDALIVHETLLSGGELSEEAFLREGRGSAFEARTGELVVVQVDEAGLAGLPAKVEQLVDRGFHALVISLEGVAGFDDTKEAFRRLLEAGRHVERFVGFVRLADASPAVRTTLETFASLEGVEELFQFVVSREQAFEAFRRYEAEGGSSGSGPVLEVTSADGLGTSSDDLTPDPADAVNGISGGGLAATSAAPAASTAEAPAEVGAPDDWGWAPPSDEQPLEPEGPAVEVAELLVQGSELEGLSEAVAGILAKGKRYVTLRVHFGRGQRMESEHVGALIQARDMLAAQGGQLALVALQEEFLKWLRLLDEERQFLILETADEAEAAHRAHASGAVPHMAPAPAAEAASPFVVVDAGGEAGEDRFVVRPRELEGQEPTERRTLAGRVVVLGPEGIPSLGGYVQRLAREGVQDVIADLRRFESLEGQRFDPLAHAASTAAEQGARLTFANVSREARALLKILGVEEELLQESVEAAVLQGAARVHALAPFDELTLELSREELLEPPPLEPISSIELDAEPALGELGGDHGGGLLVDAGAVDSLRKELATSHARLEQVQAEVAAARRREDDARAERDRARGAVEELEATHRRQERQLLELEQAKRRAERRTSEVEGTAQTLRDEAERLSQELQRLRRELDEARSQAASAGETSQRVSWLESELRGREQKIEELEGAAARIPELESRCSRLQDSLESVEQAAEQRRLDLEASLHVREEELERVRREQAEAQDALVRERERSAGLEGRIRELEASTGNGGADGERVEELTRRCEALELEKARILTEAEQEIERLSREREVLRDELESAGEMIERLGKELELS